jgi:hypothetical protein
VVTITFTNTSVPSDCQTVLVSEVSREIFKGKQQQTLSSNFVNFYSFLFYAVKNANGANVGIVIGDGTVINFGSQPLDSVTVCISFNTSALSEDYPTFDFAYRYSLVSIALSTFTIYYYH